MEHTDESLQTTHTGEWVAEVARLDPGAGDMASAPARKNSVVHLVSPSRHAQSLALRAMRRQTEHADRGLGRVRLAYGRRSLAQVTGQMLW